MIFRRQLLMNLWIFDNMVFVVLHVSAPYKSTYFTFELKIFIFVPLEMFLVLHYESILSLEC